jgi:hypothetical protein
MTCRAWNARENWRFSCLEKVSEDFFHGQIRSSVLRGCSSGSRREHAQPGVQVVKLEFLIPGSPTPAFFSQVAMFRLALDALGGIYERARVVLCLGDPPASPLPDRWRAHLRRVDVVWAPPELCRANGGPGGRRYDELDPSCDLAFLCDADTLPMRAFAPDDLRRFVDQPAIRGVIAHYPPPLQDESGNDYSARGPEWFWQFIASRTLGSPLPLDHSYSLLPAPCPCPFYVNYGVVIGTYDLLKILAGQLAWIRPRIRETLANRFVGQISLAVGCVAARLAVEALPMRYNFPNDRLADSIYPEELEQVVMMHYLRVDRFDRHRIFTSPEEFQGFLQLDLEGSDLVVQRRVRDITGGRYPFG